MLYIRCRSPLESGGIHWTPLESDGIRWSPLESTGVCWNPMESAGLVQRNSMMEFRGLRRTPPGLNMPIWPLSHQHISGFESGGVRWNPAEHVGECTVLPVLHVSSAGDDCSRSH